MSSSRMGFGALLLLSIGLAMDATAVAAARGLSARRILPQHVVLVAFLFGGFQALMPLLGWLVGSHVGPIIERFDHWVAFLLLGGIGAKMLHEAYAGNDNDAPHHEDPFRVSTLLVLALATSIDALAVGVTLPILGAPLLLSITTIGITTAVLSSAGLLIGRRFGSQLGKRLDIAGGLVLIGLGTKILIQHVLAG